MFSPTNITPKFEDSLFRSPICERRGTWIPILHNTLTWDFLYYSQQNGRHRLRVVKPAAGLHWLGIEVFISRQNAFRPLHLPNGRAD